MPSIPKLVSSKPSGAHEGAIDLALSNVREALERLRYGAIQIIVHDGKLVQVEVTERRRFS